jgi:hypothetical protein
MSKCANKIAVDITSKCADPLFQGHAQKAWLINKADLASFTASDNTISAITLATGAKAVAIEVNTKNPFNGTLTAMEEGDIRNTFTHTVTFHIPNDGAAFRKDIVDNIVNGKFVIIVENEWQGTSGDHAFSVYGIDKGLQASGDNTEDSDNGGWTFTLVESGVATSGKFFWDTDYATSLSSLDALLS